MTFLIARLGERSTWTGIGVLLSLVGIHFAPETWGAVINAGMALAALAAVLTRTTPKTPTERADPHAEPPAPIPSTIATSVNSGGGAG